jgi:hypothetical protein
MNHLRFCSIAIPVLMLTCASCSRLPSRIEMPDFDPATAAVAAIKEYDTNGDGQLQKAEFSKSPALVKAAAQFDANGDGLMSESELVARLQNWLESKAALHILPVHVNLRGQGLPGATVRFVPEAFLGEAFHPAEAVTDPYGVAILAHAREHRPDPDFPQGVKTGLYRVEITKQENGKELIPPKYNTQTTLGQEVAQGAAGMGQQMLSFDLQ